MMNYVTFDSNGSLTGAYQQDLQPEHADCHIEVSDSQRRNWTAYRANEARTSVDMISVPSQPTEDQLRDQFKARRAAAVAAIVVTVDGMQFDGDETSQNRMARAIIALQSANVATTKWTLSNNAEVEVTLEQLSEALAKAGAEQTALWTLP